jgi:hypothetical protein
MFAPVYSITPAITKALMSIDADRQAVADRPRSVEYKRARQKANQ